ncbi:MAG: hypothetical protein WC530_10110 [Candidatus Omnitrophota bacterium]
MDYNLATMTFGVAERIIKVIERVEFHSHNRRASLQSNSQHRDLGA